MSNAFEESDRVFFIDFPVVKQFELCGNYINRTISLLLKKTQYADCSLVSLERRCFEEYNKQKIQQKAKQQICPQGHMNTHWFVLENKRKILFCDMCRKQYEVK